MEQRRVTRGGVGLGAACCCLAVVCGTAFGDCVDDGICVMYKDFHYKTLDETLHNQTSIGCQSEYLPLPEGWEIAGSDDDRNHVARTYEWGTHVIVHCQSYYYCAVPSKLGSTTSSYSGHRIYTSSSGGVTTYRPVWCNARMLIRRQAEISCSSSEGSVRVGNGVRLQCYSCPAGHRSYGGVNPGLCRPPLALAASQVVNSPPTDFKAEEDSDRIVRFSFSATGLPVVYEPVRLQYAIDVQPNESSLDLQGTSLCQQKWSSITTDDEVNFTIALTYSNLNEECELGSNITKDVVERNGVIGVALIVTDEDGIFQGTVDMWYYPITVQLSASVQAVYEKGFITEGDVNHHESTVYNANWAGSTLVLYESNDFQSEKRLALYQAGDRAYLELTLLDSKGLIVTPMRAWMSSTRGSTQDLLHNLTDSIVLLGYSSAGKSQARLSVVVQAGVNCFINVEGEISSSRRLIATNGSRHLELSTLVRTSRSVRITVKEKQSGTEEMPKDSPDADDGGTEEDSIAQLALIVGGGGLALLLIACGLCVFVMRFKAQLGEIKYKLAAMDDPEAMTT